MATKFIPGNVLFRSSYVPFISGLSAYNRGLLQSAELLKMVLIARAACNPYLQVPSNPQFRSPLEGRVIICVVYSERYNVIKTSNVYYSRNLFSPKFQRAVPPQRMSNPTFERAVPPQHPSMPKPEQQSSGKERYNSGSRPKMKSAQTVKENQTGTLSAHAFEFLRSKVPGAVDGDDYSFLELTARATVDQIKRQYKKLVRLIHPDKNNNTKESEEAFKLFQDAYDRLKVKHHIS